MGHAFAGRLGSLAAISRLRCLGFDEDDGHRSLCRRAVDSAEPVDTWVLHRRARRMHSQAEFRQRAKRIHPLDAERHEDDAQVASHDMYAPLPWLRSQSEIMVDAMSVIRHFQKKTADATQMKQYLDDPFMSWPGRVYTAMQALAGEYGTDRPPSAWAPLILVFDIPNWKYCKYGLQVRTWHSLSKQGPRTTPRMTAEPSSQITLAWANTLIDQGAAQRTRCDKEILAMLEILVREYPRRQVLVTGDKVLARHANKFCTVRGVRWFVKELQRTEEGRKAYDFLMNEGEGIELNFRGLAIPVRKAFACR